MYSTQVLKLKCSATLEFIWADVNYLQKNKHYTGLAFMIWFFVVFKVLERKTATQTWGIVYGIWPIWIIVNSGQFKIAEP